MAFMKKLKKYFIIYFVNPFIWKYIKCSKRQEFYEELKKREYLSLEENIEFQKESLRKLLKYVNTNNVYYSKLIKSKKININSNNIFEELEKFPILTKDILRKHFNELKSKNFKNKFYENTSGGSTGEPVRFLQDFNYLDKSRASVSLINSWAGRKEGDYMIKLWGSERDILKGGQGLEGFLFKHLMNIDILNSFKMSKENMFEYVDIINKNEPVLIEAYVQSIYELAKFIKEHKLKIQSPKGIITSAGTLYDYMKKEIETVFKCKVFNRYGSREVGDMACSCEKDEGLHVNIFNYYFEILDKNLKPSKPGEIGKIYVTNLNNYVMPLIRYDVGDIAISSKKQVCSCGRGLPLIKSVKGRDVNLFKNKKGDLIDGEYFTHLFYMKNWVKKFQIVQKNYDEIIIKIIGEKNQKEINEINNAIKKVMGTNCKIKWVFVHDIPPFKSGKYLYTISEI